ncbi:hypothetical protein [Isoptericola sp. NPDC056134]|uniref:hypothetical protein n=1 Tax=Isoptericola sp. NPDC056134 TaxID=3345723 RepID=UPI0035E6E454
MTAPKKSTTAARSATARGTAVAKRPAAAKAPQDRKPAETSKVKKVKDGTEVTLHGVTVTVLDSVRDDWRTIDDGALVREVLSIIEAHGGAEAKESSFSAEEDELAAELVGRMPTLMRRLVGSAGASQVYAALSREKGGGPIDFGDVLAYYAELTGALSGNS